VNEKLAVTVFTVREQLKTVGIGPVFKELAQMGYKGLQLSGLPAGYDQDEVAYHLKANNVVAAGMHVPFARLTNELDLVLKEAQKYGTNALFCPYLPEELRTEEGYRAVKEGLNKVAQQAPDFQIGFHNHAFEFETTIDGQDALSYLLEPAQDNRILAEIDVYWVKKGGRDPYAFIQTYSGRMPMIHLKDMTKDEEETFAEVGEGSIPFLPILQWGEQNGVEWYVVEQDVCKRDPMDSLRISLANLQRLATQL
jgi:sugar phosphate isomerase/epimerase